jgi:hypothetical protein
MNLNPVLQKELKVKMRRMKVVIMVMIYLFFLGLMSVFVVYNLGQESFGNKDATSGMYCALMGL